MKLRTRIYSFKAWIEHATGAVTALIVVIFLAACFSFVISFSLMLGFYGAKYLSGDIYNQRLQEIRDVCSAEY